MYTSQFSVSKRINVVIAGIESGSYAIVAKRNKITLRTCYNWRDEFIRLAKIHLSNSYLNSNDLFIRTFRKKTIERHLKPIKKLERENKHLKNCVSALKRLFVKRYQYAESEKVAILNKVAKSPFVLKKTLKILSVSLDTYKKWKEQAREGTLGLKNVLLGKATNKAYQKELFKLFHEPPSMYGFNRTTWRLEDLPKALDSKGIKLSRNTIAKMLKAAGYRFRQAKVVLTSNDPEYLEKVTKLKAVLKNLKHNDFFFSIDEYGPFTIKMQGGRSLQEPGTSKIYLKHQTAKEIIIMTAAVELKTNQVTHFYSKTKNTNEIIKLIMILRNKYSNARKLFLSWDAVVWHSSNDLMANIKQINAEKSGPKIELVPLPTRAPFLNIIEAVFSGMSKAIIHNSNYSSKRECTEAINKYFKERNKYYLQNPKKAGKKIWGDEKVPIKFNEGINCVPYNARYLNRAKSLL